MNSTNSVGRGRGFIIYGIIYYSTVISWPACLLAPREIQCREGVGSYSSFGHSAVFTPLIFLIISVILQGFLKEKCSLGPKPPPF